jgi:hypothetical protein
MNRTGRSWFGQNNDLNTKGGTEVNRAILRWISLLFIFLMGCAHTPPPGLNPTPSASGELLKKACLEAAIEGIKAEISRHQDWIDLRKQGQTDSQDLPDLESKMSLLKAALEKYRSLYPNDYQLSEVIKLKAWVDGRAEANAILHIEGMSRSGPWYHLAGIKGDDYEVLKPGIKYLMSCYKVYPRSYFNMESSYIYLAEYHEIE